jgi:hypothetical protein
MTSQGAAAGRFQRAIQRGHLLAADTAARELGSLSPSEALAPTLLYEREGDPQFERAFSVGSPRCGVTRRSATARANS